LGGNIGNPKKNIQEALKLLESINALKVTKLSSYYKTAPVGYEKQDWFVNVVAEVDTTLKPYELLTLCNTVEYELKRVRLIRWGPRTIDIDILLYEGYESNDSTLTIPHPRMCERAFVIVPLMEIAPDLQIKGRPIKDIAENIHGQEIRKLEDD
jgi:2-amino-4-hydroxy-6-hydroxymethyldihydropteridine diphosphokinase